MNKYKFSFFFLKNSGKICGAMLINMHQQNEKYAQIGTRTWDLPMAWKALPSHQFWNDNLKNTFRLRNWVIHTILHLKHSKDERNFQTIETPIYHTHRDWIQFLMQSVNKQLETSMVWKFLSSFESAKLKRNELPISLMDYSRQ